MIKLNPNFFKLKGSFLFAEVSRLVDNYKEKNPDKKVIKLGIGDVTEPLVPSVVWNMHIAVDEMGKKESFRGYPPYEGYDFLREKIANFDFISRGIDVSPNEIFVSSGAKEDVANIQELFSTDIKIGITDPVYPVYLDTNVIAGRTGEQIDGRYQNVYYLECNQANNFLPEIPKEPVDLIYLCFPNNPTGQVATKEYLEDWVAYAYENKSLIIYDAAYEAFIRDPDIPHSIFEIPGAKEVALEMRSLSKTAGFTGVRCSYTIIPKKLRIIDHNNIVCNIHDLWLRRQSTKFNGVSYITQKGAEQAFTKEGREQIDKVNDYYLENARIISETLTAIGIEHIGRKNSPYLWCQTPGSYLSWDFFNKLLNDIQLVVTPGVGFGLCGEGYIRISSFNSRENVLEAVSRLRQLKI